MKRRKALLGLGSLAAGGAIVTGSGAFTSVAAERSARVAVTDDSSALLTLDATANNTNRAYAVESGTEVRVDLDAVNQDATTRVFDIFDVRNEGTQSAVVYAPNGPLGDQGAFDDTDSDGIYLDPQFSEMPRSGDPDLAELPDGTTYGSLTNIGGTLYSQGKTFEEGLDDGVSSTAPIGPAAYTLDPGESFAFGLYVRTADDAPTGATTFDIPIRADASLANKYGTGSI